MRNFYHIIIGFAIGYFAFLLFGINVKNFPLTAEYWNNFLTPLLGLIIAAIPAFFWERFQETKLGMRSDMNDVYRTGLGGFFGGLLAMFWINWILCIVMVCISIYLVVKHYKK